MFIERNTSFERDVKPFDSPFPPYPPSLTLAFENRNGPGSRRVRTSNHWYGSEGSVLLAIAFGSAPVALLIEGGIFLALAIGLRQRRKAERAQE